MRRFARNVLVGLALAACFAMAPGRASAVGYEDSLDDCAYPKTFDVLLMRPLSFAATAIGSVLLLFPVGPIALVTVPSEIGQVAENLVGAPARFTFSRPLGECTGVTTAY